MNESLPSIDPGTQKRRSTRIVQAIPLTVSGVDALGQPFKERTTTVMVNCHGCKYQSKHYVPKNSVVTLEIPRMEPALPPRQVPGRVVWVQRPRTVRELFQIGLEFEIAGNVWGIAFPPEDWVPYPEDQAAAPAAPPEIPAFPEMKPVARQPKTSAPAATLPEKKVEASAAPPAAPVIKTAIPPPPAPSMSPAKAPPTPAPRPPIPAPPAVSATPPVDSKIHVMPTPAQAQDTQIVVARQVAKMVAEAKDALDTTIRKGAQTAINEEMTIVRQQLDAQLHETVEHAIKVSMERVSESAAKKVIQQAADRTAAIVEEARKASEAEASQLDLKVRQAVQDAVSDAAQRAAREAADQAASQNLKQTVEDVVERAIAHREAATPSLQILSSPEAAQKQLDEWKKDLEETAGSVRKQLVEQSQAEAESASRRWHEELETMLAGSSHKLGDKLNETAQAALAETDREITSRSEGLRGLLQEVISGAQSSIQSLGEELAQKRVQTEATKVQLEEAAKLTVEETRRQLDQMLTSQYEEVARKADQAVAERVQQIQPVLRDSAQRMMEQFSGELGHTLTSKLEEAQKAAAELARAGERVSDLQSAIREEVQRTSEQTAQAQNEALERIKQLSGEAVEKAVSQLSDAAHQATQLEASIREQVQQAAEQATRLQTQALEQVQNASADTVGKAVSQLSDAARQATQLEASIREQVQQAAQQATRLQTQALEQVQNASADTVGKAVSQLSDAARQATQLEASIREQVQQAAQQATRLQTQALEQVQNASADTVGKAVSQLSDAARQATQLEASIREQAQQAAEQATRLQTQALEQVQKASANAVEKALSELSQAKQQTTELQGSISEQAREASEEVSRVQNAAIEKLHTASADLVQGALSRFSEAEQRVAGLESSLREQTQQASEQVARLQHDALEKVQRASTDTVQQTLAQLSQAEEQAVRLQNSIAQQAHQVSEQARLASEQTVQQSIERLRDEAAKYPAELDQSCRAVLTKTEEELEQKSSEVQHATYDALLKSAEWYQKKAQTTMQSTLEKVVEQSAATLRDRAGEVSSLVASELDHYRRSYVEHSRAEIEEAAKEVTELERTRLVESAEAANTGFSNQVQHVTQESLRRFQETTRDALEKARSDMEYNREGSLTEFQKHLDERITQGVEQAGIYLQSQLVPMLEEWEEKRQAEKRDWFEQLKRSSEESIELYKARLENATNSWLVASAATLGQNSQAVLDNLAKAAERRIRETCSQVLAGMGDTLKQRLLGISTDFGLEEEDDPPEDKT